MSVFTPMDNDDVKQGNLVSVELFNAIATNINHLLDSAQIGKITAILYGFPGVPQPDPKYWQECDGSLITEETSPLRGQSTPDYATLGRYLRGYGSIGEAGQLSGSNTKNLQHSHGGQTNGQSGITQQADTDDNFWDTNENHTHSISNDLGTAINFEPEHLRLKFYLKIK